MPPIFISIILQSVRKENLAHYFPYDVKLRLLAHSRSFLADQKARNAIVGAENLLKTNRRSRHQSRVSESVAWDQLLKWGNDVDERMLRPPEPLRTPSVVYHSHAETSSLTVCASDKQKCQMVKFPSDWPFTTHLQSPQFIITT